jgi:hypothetical protein
VAGDFNVADYLRTAARHLTTLLGQLADQIEDLQKKCDAEREYAAYLESILKPIVKEYPALLPPKLVNRLRDEEMIRNLANEATDIANDKPKPTAPRAPDSGQKW